MKRLLRRLGCLNPTLPVFLGLTVMILSLGLTNVMLWGTRFNFSSNSPPSPALPTPPEVLGSWYQKEPAIMISGGEGWSANGGVIALASTDEPSVTIESYRVTGDVTVKLYPATEAQLFAYLTYNDDYKKINPAVTPSTNPITEFTYTLPGENNQGSPLVLPLEPSGLYHLNISNGSAHADAFVIRSQTGVLVKEGDNQFVFWGQDYQTKRSLNQGTIRILSAKNQATDLTTAVFNDSGIATAPISYQADFAWVSRDADRALVPLNLKYLNSR